MQFRKVFWVDLLQLPPLPWTDARKAQDASRRLESLSGEITSIDPTRLDHFLLWFYSQCYLPLRSAFRKSRSTHYGANDTLTIICPGHGVLYPGQILKSGLLNDPALRERALTLFDVANRCLGIDLWSFHVPDATPERDSFCAELFQSGATNADQIRATRRLHPPVSPAYHFAAGPHGVLSLIDQVLRIEYLLRGSQKPVCFLTISAGIFAALYCSLDVPFEVVSRFMALELAPHTDDFETALAREFLLKECGVPLEGYAGDSAPMKALLDACRPGMLGVAGLYTGRLNELVATCNAELGTRIEIGLRMSPLLHVAVGLRPHLHTLTAFIRARLGWFGSDGLPVRFRLLPVTHGSHHSANQPIRGRVASQLQCLLAQHPGDRLRHSIFHTRTGQEPALYNTVEELYEGVLRIIDSPVDLTGSLQDAFRTGSRKFVVTSSGASSFAGKMMRANIDEACQAFDVTGVDVYAPDGLDELEALARMGA